jgi:hypothetical protein
MRHNATGRREATYVKVGVAGGNRTPRTKVLQAFESALYIDNLQPVESFSKTEYDRLA